MIEDINTELLEACEAALEELRLLISEDELVFKQVETAILKAKRGIT